MTSVKSYRRNNVNSQCHTIRETLRGWVKSARFLTKVNDTSVSAEEDGSNTLHVRQWRAGRVIPFKGVENPQFEHGCKRLYSTKV